MSPQYHLLDQLQRPVGAAMALWLSPAQSGSVQLKELGQGPQSCQNSPGCSAAWPWPASRFHWVRVSPSLANSTRSCRVWMSFWLGDKSCPSPSGPGLDSSEVWPPTFRQVGSWELTSGWVCWDTSGCWDPTNGWRLSGLFWSNEEEKKTPIN